MNAVLAMGMPGTTEMLIIFGVVFFLFGGKKIPEFARGIGKGISEFKKGRRELEDALDLSAAPRVYPSNPNNTTNSSSTNKSLGGDQKTNS